MGVRPCVVAADQIAYVRESVGLHQRGGHTGAPAAGAMHHDRLVTGNVRQLRIERISTEDDIQRAYLELLDGNLDPASGIVVDLG